MKRELAINIIGGLVTTIAGGILMWKLEPYFKSNPEERKTTATVAANSLTSAQSGSRPSPDASIPQSALSVKHAAQPGGAHYINTVALSDSKPITPVAVKGSAGASRDVLEALAVPLKQGLFTNSFFNDGVFERALNGEGGGIAHLKLPKEINKIVLLQVGEEKRVAIPDSQGATKAKRNISITVMEAQSGAVIKAARFTAEGVGFDEEYIERSLKEDLAVKLEPVRRAL